MAVRPENTKKPAHSESREAETPMRVIVGYYLPPKRGGDTRAAGGGVIRYSFGVVGNQGKPIPR